MSTRTTNLTGNGRWQWVISLLIILTCLVSACSSNPPATEAPAATEAPDAEVEPAEVAEEETEEETEEEASSSDSEAEEAEEGEDEDEDEDEEAEETTAEGLPGEGITVRPMNGGTVTDYFQHFVLQRIIEEMGYTVEEHAEAQFPALHLALGNGDVDYTANHWDPLHEAFYLEAGGAEKMSRIGQMISGAGQGYLIDKATAEEHGITNLEDFKDPEIAALFDTDGDGKANLIGCDPGWGCERVIEHHIDAYELRDSINHDQGSYFAIIADGIARYEAGEPVLYYTWTPMWLGNLLVPGEDTVWLNVPFSTQPDGGTEDTSTPDGNNTGFIVNSVRVVANNEFLMANPPLARLFELYELPINDVSAENQLVNDGENTVADIYRHADEWVAANRDTIDAWIADASTATEVDLTSYQAEESADEEHEEEAMMDDTLPGEGITVRPMNGGTVTDYFQHFVLQRIVEELGYTVEEHAEAQFPALHLALGNGDVDYTANHWDPLHEAFYLEAGGAEKMSRIGQMISGAGQGYLIDKATAEEHGITNLEDFKDPEIAALFDTDGDGKANLIGCDPGWGCERVIEHHIDAYELRDSINHDQGSYFAIIADGIARYEAGEPVLYYTWTPMWLGNLLVPGEDTVWLNVPFSTQPDGGTEDTSTPDGNNTGFIVNSVRVVANNEFLMANPPLARLFELYELPINDVSAENQLVNDGENTVADIYRHADEWIAANRDTVDGWLAEAKKAAK